jgi:hypothetical protein
MYLEQLISLFLKSKNLTNKFHFSFIQFFKISDLHIFPTFFQFLSSACDDLSKAEALFTSIFSTNVESEVARGLSFELSQRLTLLDSKVLDLFNRDVNILSNLSSPDFEVSSKIEVKNHQVLSDVLALLSSKSLHVVSEVLSEIYLKVWRGVVLPLLETVSRLGEQGYLQHTVRRKKIGFSFFKKFI